MTFEMFGAGCFGAVIGFVAWHVFRTGDASLDVKRLAAFIGALLGAVVLSAFPAGTTLFAAYSCGLALGFFLIPVSRIIVTAFSSMNQFQGPDQLGASSEVADQFKESPANKMHVSVSRSGMLGAWRTRRRSGSAIGRSGRC
jgi:hypothetical protein